MNAHQIDLCRRIQDSLLRRPISQLFWTVPLCELSAGKRPPISFSWILERIDRGLYGSADEWIGDIRLLFVVPNPRSASLLRRAAAQQLGQEFEELLLTLSPGISPHIAQLQMAEGRIESLVGKAPPLARVSVVAKERKPAAEIFKRERSDDMAVLADDIRKLFTPNLLLRVAAFVSVVDPPALVFDDDTMRILLVAMSSENREKLRGFVWKLMEEAAIGALDVFVDRRPALQTQVM
jgi:hypothetical protein